MSLKVLSYLGIRSDKLNDCSSFAGGLLGLQKIDKGGKSMAFRMDSQEQRLLVSDELGETLAFMGWEVGARDDLETLAAKLDAAGTPVHIGSRELADRHLVQDLIWFWIQWATEMNWFTNQCWSATRLFRDVRLMDLKRAL